MSILSNLTTTPLLWACGGLLAAGLTAYTVQTIRLGSAQTDAAEARATLATERASNATDLLVFAATARETERQLRDQFGATSQEYTEALQNAQVTTDRTVADLRAGNVRLQARWRACTAAARVPGTTEPALGADAGADDRADSAARIIGAADRCDAQVRGLQRLLIAERTHD